MDTVDAEKITAAFVEEARKTLRRMKGKIVHCIGQLTDDDLNWRAFAGANSVGNLVMHLCGNISQWIVAGVGGKVVERDRPGEFSQELLVSRGKLLERLEEVVGEADEAIAGVSAEGALSRRRIQGFDETALSAIFHAVTHFEGHTHQIIFITRSRLGEGYVFKWEPTTPEQVSGRK